MPAGKTLNAVSLTRSGQLHTLVENRRIYNLNDCELNIFESYQTAYDFPLTFNDVVITSMIRGKKIMHLRDKPVFEYLPGETVIANAKETMVIDFPEAEAANPTQCIALTLDGKYVADTVNYLNSQYNCRDEAANWQLKFEHYHFQNNNEIAASLNKLIRICASDDIAKNIYADLNLKELLIRLMQSQNLATAADNSHSNSTRINFIFNYIQQHLTDKISVDMLSKKAYLSRNLFFKWFKEQVGITPLEYINRERIKMAKQLLADRAISISDVSLQCGFNDVNYFVRLFRKSEGITPGAYQSVRL
ncbi:MAG: AraC family transcriptional regulator [Niabella sp.]